MPPIEPDPCSLPARDLAGRAAAEYDSFHLTGAADERYALELARRAVADRDHDCWSALWELYTPLVASWCGRAGAPAEARDEAINAAWARFAHGYTTEKLAVATGLAGVLGYLRTCCWSVVIDAHRARQAECEPAIPDDTPDTAPSPEELAQRRAAAAELWRVVQRELRHADERALVELHYVLGLPSAQVQAARLELFPTIGHVYRVSRRVVNRLRRSAELRRWLAQGGWADVAG